MRNLFQVVLVMVLAILVYLGIGSDAFILVKIGVYSLQMKLLVAVVCLALLVWVSQILIGFLTGRSIRVFQKRVQRRSHNKELLKALNSWVNRKWSKAYDAFVQLANKGSSEVLPYILLAAQSAQKKGEWAEANATFDQAANQYPNSYRSIKINQAIAAMSAGEFDVAQAIVQTLTPIAKNESELHLLRLELSESMDSPDELAATISDTLKVVSNKSAFIHLSIRNLSHRLVSTPAPEELNQWVDIVEYYECMPVLLVEKLVVALDQNELFDRADNLARKQISVRLSNEWGQDSVERLLGLYARSRSTGSAHKKIKQIEKWIKMTYSTTTAEKSIAELAQASGNSGLASRYPRITDSAPVDSLEKN